MYPTPLPKFAASADGACPIHPVGPEGLDALEGATGDWAKATGFAASAGEVCLVPGEGGLAAVLLGLGAESGRSRRRFVAGDLPSRLPEGVFALAPGLEARDAEEFALGWLFGCYRFTRYVEGAMPKAELAAPEGVDAARLEAIAAGEFLTRDLINTPTSDMGPEALEDAFMALAAEQGATASAIRGDDLLTQNFPRIPWKNKGAARRAIGRPARGLSSW